MNLYPAYLRRLCALFATLWLSIGALGAFAEASLNSNPKVLIKTTDGDITVELFADKSPITVENFLRYVDDGYYDGTVFHRVISNFMIQGGGFTSALEEKATRAPIVNESRNKVHNTRGTLAMARTNDPNSATAQFFINQRSNLRLDWTPSSEGYTVFARWSTACKWSISFRYQTRAPHPPKQGVVQRLSRRPVKPVRFYP